MLKCDGCTVCCYLFEVKDLNKGRNADCKHCDNGCLIYEKRPKDCLGFQCAYLQMKKVSKDLRPDNCGVVFEKVNYRIFFGTQDPRREINNVAKAQITSFKNQGFSVIIHQSGKNYLFLAPGHHGVEIKKEFKKHLARLYGSTKLYH